MAPRKSYTSGSDRSTIAHFQKELGAMGYRFQALEGSTEADQFDDQGVGATS